jgi:large subunit ribosomal protein L21
MFAIIIIAGFQEKVSEGMRLQVPSLEGAEGSTVTFDKVLLISKDGSSATLGKPTIVGASVTARIVRHGRGEKVVVTKFKRRKRYNKTLRGHRQNFTEVEIQSIKA